MRKAKVNDIVRSFVYAVRTRSDWPFPILGRNWENAMQPLRAASLVPFAAFAYAETRNYIVTNRQVILVASYLRDLAELEQDYAASLMIRYYLPGVAKNVCL